jgi:hypothetical protein
LHIILSAAKYEAQPTLDQLQENGIESAFISIGVGALNAAKNAATISDHCEGKHIIVIGTCGIFGDFSKPTLITTNNVHWQPTSVKTGEAYLIKGLHEQILLNKETQISRDLTPKATICGSAISLNEDPPSGFALNDAVENLELYSCIEEIHNKALTLDVVLGITNQVGPAAHAQWKSNHSALAEMTAKYISSSLINNSRE